MFVKLMQVLSGKERTHPFHHIAASLYAQAMEQSRQPVFYTDLGVADSIDGRFDMLALHVAPLFYRLRSQGFGADELREKERTLIDVMMADMDQSLREQSVGDSGVLRRVQKMGEALYGRVSAYETTDKAALKTAIIRNVYRSEEAADAQESAAEKLADYALKTREIFASLSFEEFANSPLSWPNF